MNIDIGTAITDENLTEYVETLLFGPEYTIQQVCGAVCMTEAELRAIPAINELFNK